MFKTRARELIKLYREGSDLTDEESHVLNDTASEHGQILDNVHMKLFEFWLAENLEALEFPPSKSCGTKNE